MVRIFLKDGSEKGLSFTDSVGVNISHGAFTLSGPGNEFFLDNAGFEFEETEEFINFNSLPVKVSIEEEFGTKYPVWDWNTLPKRALLSYSKSTHHIDVDFSSAPEPYLQPQDKEPWLYDYALARWLSAVVYSENKYMYSIYSSDVAFSSWSGWSSFKANINVLNNTIKFINDGTFNSLESVIKSLGVAFFRDNIADPEFTLNNARKLHRVIELPKDVIDFLKVKEYSALLPKFRIICMDDPNEGIALVNWYNIHAKLQNLKNGTKDFEKFVGLLSDIKSKYESKISMHRLLPYLTAQNFYSCSDVTDAFTIPYDTLREYRDYLNLGNISDLYPASLPAAHNLALRNLKICENKELCDKFAKVVEPLKELEWVHDGLAVVAPVKAEDFVKEGEALHHCLATYVELVARGVEKVMFVRLEGSKDVSYVTFSFDDDYNIIEAKKAFNQDVDEPEVLQLFADWKKRNKARERATAKKGV
jgi:hypothetical protein